MSSRRIRASLIVLPLVQLIALSIGARTHGGSLVAGGVIVAAGVAEIVIIWGSGRRQHR